LVQTAKGISFASLWAYGTTHPSCNAASRCWQENDGNRRAGTNYLNSSIVTLTKQTNDGITPNCKITCIQADVVAEDMYTASVRQAAAMEQMVDKFGQGLKVNVKSDNTDIDAQLEKINSTLKESGAKQMAPQTGPITVIKDKSFDIWTVGTSNGGVTKNVTIIDNDTSDNYIQVIGKISTVGTFEVVIDGKKYVFNVIEEPNSSNINAVLH